MRSFLPWLLVAFVSVSYPHSVRAQETREYKELVGQAVQEFDAGNWLEARVLFQRAHALNPNARTWRSLGITAFELRRYVDAIAELEAALADQRKPLTDQARAEVSELLARAREFVAVYKLAVRPEGAQVLVDGKPAALRDGQLFLDPGSHTVVVRAPGFEEARKDLRIDEPRRDQLVIELRLAGQAAPEEAPTAPVPTPPATPANASPAKDQAARPRVWAWVLGGGALAAGGAGVGLGLAARSKHHDFVACDVDCGSLKAEGQHLQLATNVAYGAAGALLAGAVVSWFVEGKGSERKASATVYLTPHAWGVRGSF